MAGIHKSKFDRGALSRRLRSKKIWEKNHPIRTKFCLNCHKRRIGKHHHLYCDICHMRNQKRKNGQY